MDHGQPENIMPSPGNRQRRCKNLSKEYTHLNCWVIKKTWNIRPTTEI